jgi:hypothetical protein
MRGLHVLFGLALTAAMASSAAASPERDYAACVARVRPEVATRLLDAQTDSQARAAFKVAANNDYCFSRAYAAGTFHLAQDALSIGMLRGIFADQALTRNRHAVAPPALPSHSQSYVRTWFAATGRAAAVDEMAACMADTDPASIMGLLRTAPGSWDEQSWMQSLPASLSRCLRVGVHLDANRGALRAALADALYQRVHAQSATVASGR